MSWIQDHATTWTGTQASVGAGAVLQDGWINALANRWDISGGVLRLLITGGFNTSFLLRPSGENAADKQITTHIVANPTIRHMHLHRYQDANNFYLLEADFGAAAARIWSYVAGVLTQIGADQSFTLPTGHTADVTTSVQGTTLTITVVDTTASSTLVTYTQTSSAISASGQAGLSSNTAGTLSDSTGVTTYNWVTTQITVTGPNGATTLPSNHNGNIALTVVGIGTSFTTATLTASGVAGWAKVSQSVVDDTHATLVVSCPAVATPPAGATGTLTVSDGTTTGTIPVNTPTLTVSPTVAKVGGSPLVYATSTNALWQGDNPTFTVAGGTGASVSGSAATSNSASSFTLAVGSSAATETITDPSTGATATVTVSAIVAGNVADPHVLYSPYTWEYDGGGNPAATRVGQFPTRVRSTSPGAYIKINYTGTGITLNYNSAMYSAAGDYPILLTSVDNGPWVKHQLASTEAGAYVIVSGQTQGAHSLILIFSAIGNYSAERWQLAAINNGYATPPYAVLEITGFTIAGTASTQAVTARTKNLLVFGDSMVEGLHAEPGNFSNSDGRAPWGTHLAEALDAEVGIVGFNGQRLTSTNGTLPGLRGGVGANRTWDKFNQAVSRLFGGLLSPAPDYVAVSIGTNDGLNGAVNATFTAAVQALATDLTAAAPVARGFLLLPPGRFMKTAHAAATLPGGWYLIDAGAEMAAGLTNNTAGDGTAGYGAASRHSQGPSSGGDGLHPDAQGHAEYAARIIQTAIKDTTVNPTGRRTIRE